MWSTYGKCIYLYTFVGGGVANTQFCIAGQLRWRIQNAPKFLAAGALSRTPLGKLTAANPLAGEARGAVTGKPCMVLVVDACYLGHPKNWLIDWLIDTPVQERGGPGLVLRASSFGLPSPRPRNVDFVPTPLPPFHIGYNSHTIQLK